MGLTHPQYLVMLALWEAAAAEGHRAAPTGSASSRPPCRRCSSASRPPGWSPARRDPGRPGAGRLADHPGPKAARPGRAHPAGDPGTAEHAPGRARRPARQPDSAHRRDPGRHVEAASAAYRYPPAAQPVTWAINSGWKKPDSAGSSQVRFASPACLAQSVSSSRVRAQQQVVRRATRQSSPPPTRWKCCRSYLCRLPSSPRPGRPRTRNRLAPPRPGAGCRSGAAAAPARSPVSTRGALRRAASRAASRAAPPSRRRLTSGARRRCRRRQPRRSWRPRRAASAGPRHRRRRPAVAARTRHGLGAPPHG